MKRMTVLGGWLSTALVVAFVVGAPSRARSAHENQADKGLAVYTGQKCQVCHSVGGKGNSQNPLDGVGTKLSAAEIRAWIVDPAGMTAKTKSTKKPPMPARYSKLPTADLDALVAYMESLK